MNKCCLNRSTISLVVLLVLATVSAPALHAAAGVRFQLTEDSLILIPVTADDQGPFYFFLDTGTDTTIVDTALAKKLLLPTLQSAQLTTTAGVQTVTVSPAGKAGDRK